MARDIFSILSISAKVERLFSSTKLIIPNHRNSLKPECIRSWALNGLVIGNYFEYLTAT